MGLGFKSMQVSAREEGRVQTTFPPVMNVDECVLEPCRVGGVSASPTGDLGVSGRTCFDYAHRRFGRWWSEAELRSWCSKLLLLRRQVDALVAGQLRECAPPGLSQSDRQQWAAAMCVPDGKHAIMQQASPRHSSACSMDRSLLSANPSHALLTHRTGLD